MKLKKPQIHHKKPLVKNLLLIEGISRAGKFLLANLINGFKDIEPAQGQSSLEHIPFLEHFGLIDKETAKELLQCDIDSYVYGMLVGRNFNFRRSDKSSIFNLPHYRKILQRSHQSDVVKILNDYYKKSVYSPFIIHELMPFIKLYLEIFPQIKIINLQRSPLDLVSSWYKRGYGTRPAKEPTFFMITFKTAKGPVPWYAYHFPKNFYSLSVMDRIIASIEILTKLYNQTLAQLSSQDKKKILILNYENILLNPQKIITTLGKFLGRQSLPAMQNILKREKLPNHHKLITRKQKHQEIKTLATKEYFEKLLKLEKEYYRKYNIKL